MATTAQEHLDAVNAAITARLAGDGYHMYGQMGRQWIGCTLPQLYQVRRELQAEVAAESGTQHALAEPFEV